MLNMQKIQDPLLLYRLYILIFKEHGNLLIIYIGHTYLAVRDLLSASSPLFYNRDKKAGLQRFYAN